MPNFQQTTDIYGLDRRKINLIIAQGSDSSLDLEFFVGSEKTYSAWTVREKVPGGFEPGTP